MLPLQTILKNATTFPEKIAIKDGEVSLSWSAYSNILKTTLVNLQKNYDVDQINRVLVISKNRWELMILYSALSTLKIPYTGVDYSSTIAQKFHCFNGLKPDLVIYSDEFSDDVKNFDTVSLLNIDYDFAKLNTKVDIEEDNIIKSTKDRIFESFSFTSGTSGFPKVVYRNTAFEAQRMKKLTEIYNFNSDDKFLVTIPFYHVSVSGWIRLFMNLGCTIVFSDFNSQKDMYSKLIGEKITSMLIVPPVLNKLLSYMDDKSKNTSLKFIMVGGKNFPAILKQKAIKYLGNVVNEYYGSTETGINVLSNTNIMNIDPYSSGVPMEGSEVIILDKDNSILSYNNIGRIAIHSYQNAHSYLNNKLNTLRLFNKTYIVTADYGYMDEFGKIFVICRSDTMDGSISFNLYKLENKIRLINGVQDVVITIKNNNGVDETIIYISTEKYVYENLKNDIKSIVECLVEDKLLLKVKFVDEIPYSLSGKVKFRELEEN